MNIISKNRTKTIRKILTRELERVESPDQNRALESIEQEQKENRESAFPSRSFQSKLRSTRSTGSMKKWASSRQGSDSVPYARYKFITGNQK